jgi:hypothetical protein
VVTRPGLVGADEIERPELLLLDAKLHGPRALTGRTDPQIQTLAISVGARRLKVLFRLVT